MLIELMSSNQEQGCAVLNTRIANVQDVSTVLQWIQKKAKFDTEIGSFSGVLEVTEAKLKETLFGELPFAEVLLGEINKNSIGFALYYFRYSSFLARPSLWVDDLYIDAERRNQGIGTEIIIQLARIAREKGCTHMAWNAWADNISGVSFYQKIGARIIKAQGKLLFFQMEL